MEKLNCRKIMFILNVNFVSTNVYPAEAVSCITVNYKTSIDIRTLI